MKTFGKFVYAPINNPIQSSLGKTSVICSVLDYEQIDDFIEWCGDYFPHQFITKSDIENTIYQACGKTSYMGSVYVCITDTLIFTNHVDFRKWSFNLNIHNTDVSLFRNVSDEIVIYEFKTPEDVVNYMLTL